MRAKALKAVPAFEETYGKSFLGFIGEEILELPLTHDELENLQRGLVSLLLETETFGQGKELPLPLSWTCYSAVHLLGPICYHLDSLLEIEKPVVVLPAGVLRCVGFACDVLLGSTADSLPYGKLSLREVRNRIFTLTCSGANA